MGRFSSIGHISRGWKHLVSKTFEEMTALERREAAREWIRQLLERYGLFFPELLQQEWTTVPWPELRRALSQMEWAGELISGYFVRGARSPQYISPQAAEMYCGREPMGWQVFHSSAPWSLCGYGGGLFRSSFPFSRQFGWLVCEDARWGVAVSENGRMMRFNPGWSEERLQTALHELIDWNKENRPFTGGQWILDRVQADAIDESKLFRLLEGAGFFREMDQWVMLRDS